MFHDSHGDPKMVDGVTEVEPVVDTGGSAIAAKITRNFIHSPLVPLLFLAMLIMGIVGLVFIPRQDAAPPSASMVDIMVTYPGATPAQVAALAIAPLEQMMSELSGVKHLYSVARHGEGMVTIQFNEGEALDPSVVKVHDKLHANLDKIPNGVQRPLIKPQGIDQVPVVTFTLWSESVDDGILRTLGLDLLQSLKQIPNTDQGFVVGGRSEQVRVEVMPKRLSGYGLTLDQLANTIRSANSEQTADHIVSARSSFTVQSGTFLHSAEDVARLVVSTQNSIPVYLRDVARVYQGPSETKHIVQYYTGSAHDVDDHASLNANGMAAVTVALSKKAGSSGATVAEAIITRLEQLKGDVIPDNIHVEITRQYGLSANEKINELIFNLFVVTGFVALVLIFFLGRRPAIIILSVIPVVILFTLFVVWPMGFAIDRVTLVALILSIGMVVSDAIVVVENIYRRGLTGGEVSSVVAIDAVREVGHPTILATFAIILALLPLMLVDGMMGAYMAPIPALVLVAMLLSLMAAFIFTPWLAMRMSPSMEQLRRDDERALLSAEWLERILRTLLLPIMANKKRGYQLLGTLIILLFMVSMLLYSDAVRVKMLPLDNHSEYSIVIDMPEGTALADSASLTARLVEVVRNYPEVVALQSYVGTAQPFDLNGMVRHYQLRRNPWQAEIHIQLVDDSERDRSSHDLAVMTRAAIAPIIKEAGARATVVEIPSGAPQRQAMVAEIYGPDDATRRAVARELTDIFDRAEGVGDVDNYMAEAYNLWNFEIDTARAVRRGVSVDAINRNLSMATGGYVVGDIQQDNLPEPTHIVIQSPLAVRSAITRLGELPIPSTHGTIVPLSALGSFKQQRQDPPIYHKDLRPVEYVVGAAVEPLVAPIYGMLEVEALLEDYTTPDGVALKGHYFDAPEDDSRSAFAWTGEWPDTLETFAGMAWAFGVAILLIYILLAWAFGNFVIPGLIMAPIPLTLIGIIPGHWLLGAEFSATSMVGFIVLAGIVVRNSILLIDYTMHKVREGVNLREAVVMACRARARPIVITTLALVAASLVILTDDLFQGMAISLLFGVVVSTALTLIVIPLGSISAHKTLAPAGYVVEEGELSITDFVRDMWRLLVGMFKKGGLGFYRFMMTLIPPLMERISALIDTLEPVRKKEPVITGQVVTDTSEVKTEPVEMADNEPAGEPAEEEGSQSPQPEVEITGPRVTPFSSSVPAPILEAFEKANVIEKTGGAQGTEMDEPAPLASKKVARKKVLGKKSVKKQSVEKRAVKKSVVKKRVVRKAAPKKKIALKKDATKKRVATKKVATKKKGAIKKRTVPSKSGKGRRGIRLNKDFDDIDI